MPAYSAIWTQRMHCKTVCLEMYVQALHATGDRCNVICLGLDHAVPSITTDAMTAVLLHRGVMYTICHVEPYHHVLPYHVPLPAAIEPHTLNTGPDTPTLGASRRRLGPVLINPKPGMPNSINMPAPGSATAAAAESVSSPTSQMSETRSTLSAHGMTMNRVSLGTSSNGQAGGGSGRV